MGRFNITLCYLHVLTSNYPHRTVKLSSPTLNYFIIGGAILMYVSIFFYLLPTKNEDVVKARCVVREMIYMQLHVVIIELQYNCLFSLCRLNTGSSLLDTLLLLVQSLLRYGEFFKYFITLNQTKRYK